MNNDRDPKPENAPKPREWQPPGGYEPRPYRRGDYEAARLRRERRGVR